MVNTMPDPTSSNFLPVGTAGLKSWDVVVGTGTPVAAGDSITIFYTGWLASNGTKFDSRRSPADPITFSLNGLIQGWQQGIPGMKPGGIRRLFIPAALGYGAAGSPPNIPANADLVFEIKLISHHA
ncbi:MAG TPA: FKBP-type peptidyl-prolyl cis-trans isomerase [Gemmataceae bacterium]|nr:FKBP-type peptidyl-prolyl cis-trans isomerase [Gemmataceae bacterium]